MSASSTSTSDSILIVKKTKIFSKDEMMAMRAETDFGEDVATFLDGSGLVKNTGPAAWHVKSEPDSSVSPHVSSATHVGRLEKVPSAPQVVDAEMSVVLSMW